MSQTEVQLIKADAVQTGDIADSAVTNAKISGVASSKLTGALPAISGAALTNLPASGKAHNLVINGDMKINQYGNTSSTSQGYKVCDRWRIDQDSGLTEACTQSRVDLSSSDTPYASGFRKAFRITNGNQTSQDANDYIQLVQKIEAQDMATSGWNYISDSSNITLSFWVKASIAQTFYVKIEATDASRTYTYPIAVTTSWQKLTKTIPGNSNLVFNNDNGVGMRICIIPYYGANYTTSGHSINTWIASDGANQAPDFANTWFSGNDATFDVTGVQLEVGDSATDFEHRSFGQELALCQRYYYEQSSTFYGFFGYGTNSGTNQMGNLIRPVDMRASPTITYTTGGYWSAGPYAGGNGGYYSYVYGQTTSSNGPNLSNYQLDAEL